MRYTSTVRRYPERVQNHQDWGSQENCPDGEAVDGGRAPDAEVMAKTAAKVSLWAQRTPQRTYRRSASSEDTRMK